MTDIVTNFPFIHEELQNRRRRKNCLFDACKKNEGKTYNPSTIVQFRQILREHSELFVISANFDSLNQQFWLSSAHQECFQD